MKSEKLIKIIKEININEGSKNTRSYNLELAERIILRLESLSLCSECEFLLYEFESILDDLKENFNRNPSKRYKSLIKSALLHLEKTHKLITPGHYANIYMSIGIALSLPFGVLVSFLGLPFGIGLGLLVGSIFDKKAKDAGLTI